MNHIAIYSDMAITPEPSSSTFGQSRGTKTNCFSVLVVRFCRFTSCYFAMLSATQDILCPIVERLLVAELKWKMTGETNKNHIKRSMTQSYSDSTDHVVAMDVGIRKTNLSLLRRGTLYLTLNTAIWHDVRVSALPHNTVILMQLRKNATPIYVNGYKYQISKRLSCQFLKLRRNQRHVMKGPQILCCNRFSKNMRR
jgi:hypothetical protein